MVIRAHGTSKSIHEKLKERKVKVFDATCIFVNKIRQEIEIANENGYSILFMGDKNHPEVKELFLLLMIFKYLKALKKQKK